MKSILFCFLFLLQNLCLASQDISQVNFKLYCMYTPDYKVLMEEYFLPSIQDNFEVIIDACPQDCPSSLFRADGWDKTMLNKLELLERAILENWDKIFFYADVDIIFLKPILEISLKHLGDSDFVVQQGWPKNKLCAGFFVMRGNERTLKLITKAKTLLRNKIYIDDQVAIQAVLENLEDERISWNFLPSNQFANGRRVLKENFGHYSEKSKIELDDEIILFHANCCIGLENKYHFLRRVQELCCVTWGPKQI